MDEFPQDHNSDISRIVLPSGTVIRDTYTIDRHIGRGQFADVYLVRHQYMGMQAMKVFRLFEDQEHLTTAFNEAFLLSRITHPSVVRVFDVNRLEKKYGSAVYMITEYISGGTLEEILDEKYFTLTEALDLAIQMADAIAHGHSQIPPIVHRDIKPSNILIEHIDNNWVVKVADYGLAKRVNRITETIAAGGTLLYMSPESFLGYETPRSDIYSLGIVIYQILCDCMPYRTNTLPMKKDADAIIKALQEQQQEPFWPPSYFKSDISPDIDAVVLCALSHDSKDRYRDGRSLRNALQLCRQCIEHATSKDYFTDNNIIQADKHLESRARQALSLAFTVGVNPRREHEACEWLKTAMHISPTLKERYGYYLEVWGDRNHIKNK